MKKYSLPARKILIGWDFGSSWKTLPITTFYSIPYIITHIQPNQPRFICIVQWMNPFLTKHLHSCTSQKVEKRMEPWPGPWNEEVLDPDSSEHTSEQFVSKTLENCFHKLLTKVTNPPSPFPQTILVVLFIANSPPHKKKSEDQRFFCFILLTPPKTNTSSENQWLEDDMSYGNDPFWGTFVQFRWCSFLIFLLW